MNVKFGILGCGHIAHRHAEHIINHPDAELVAAYDIMPEKTQAFCEKFNIEAVENIEALYQHSNIDVINICTPNGLHHTGAIQGLQNNKHVLVEKPMAIKKAQCEQMIAALLNSNRKMFVVKQNRFNPPIVALKKLIDEGKLGKIYSVVINCYWNRNKGYYKQSDWRGKKDLDGGTLFTQFSHFVDIFYFLFGDVEDDINGFIQNANHKDLIDFEDTGHFVFRFKNGASGSLNYTTSCFEQNMEGSIAVFAENATLKVGGQYLNSLVYQKTANFDISGLPESEPANDYGAYKGSMSNHDKTIDNIVQTLQGTDTIKTNAVEGMKVVEIIEKFYNAAQWIQ